LHGHGVVVTRSASASIENDIIQNNHGRGVSIESSELAALRDLVSVR